MREARAASGHAAEKLGTPNVHDAGALCAQDADHQNNRAAGPRNTRLLDPLARLIVQEFPSCARHRADKIIPQHQRQCRERL